MHEERKKRRERRGEAKRDEWLWLSRLSPLAALLYTRLSPHEQACFHAIALKVVGRERVRA